MLKQTPFYANNLIQEADLGGKDSGGPYSSFFDGKLDLGLTQVGHDSNSINDLQDEETAKLLSFNTMSDIIDALSEPARTPPTANFKQDHFRTKSLKSSVVTMDDDNLGTKPTFLAISGTDSENNGDFGIESSEGDQLPLIRGPAHQGLVHKLLGRLRGVKPRPRKISLQHSEDEDFEDNPKVLDNAAAIDISAHDSQVSKSSLSVGILLASISCIFFATSSLIVKVSSLHPMELLCVRGALQAIFVLPIIISSGSSILGPAGSRGLLLTRATLGSVSLIMAFNSIHLIPLADASTVIFTSPVFVSLFACICLGEFCTAFDVSMITLTVLGVVLVSKPSFGLLETPGETPSSWRNIVGIFCGVCAAMLTALAFIVLRQLKHVHYSVTVFWFSTVLAAFGAVLTMALDGLTLPDEWLTVLQCLGIGICGFLGQILLTKALQLENAGPVAVARSLDIVLSFFYQITFLHDTPDLYSYIGSGLVVACVVLTGLRRWYTEIEVKRNAELCADANSCRGRNENRS